MYNNRAIEVVGVLKYVSSKNRYYKTTAEILQRKIVIKFQCNFENEVHKIVCILNNERSKPPALAEKSKNVGSG